MSLHLVEAGEAEAPLVILLHGFPEFWWAWRHQITPLAQAGYHVVAPDLRGYNESDAPIGIAAYDLDRLAADVVAIADAYGVRRFHLVGHDWGAMIGWWVAACHPDRVARAVLIAGPHPDAFEDRMLRDLGQALRSVYALYFQLPRLPEATLRAFDYAGLKAAIRRSAKPGTFTRPILADYAAAWAKPGALTAMLNYYRALRRRRKAAPIRVVPPALILWGEEDRFLGRRIAEKSVALCDDGTLEIVPGASHWLHLEQPDLITRRILDALAA